MPFEFYNPHVSRCGCYLGSTYGEIKVEPGQYVPTPEHEKAGITSAMFEKHVAPSFLHKTPGQIRRRLREEHQSKLEARAAAKTAGHDDDDLEEAVAAGVAGAPKASAAKHNAAPRAAPVPPTGGPRRPELPAGSLNTAANALQKHADRSASSGAGKEARS